MKGSASAPSSALMEAISIPDVPFVGDKPAACMASSPDLCFWAFDLHSGTDGAEVNESGSSTSGDRASSATEERVAWICAQALELPMVSSEADLFDLGIDSVQAVTIALDLERAFSIEVPPDTIYDRSSVQALAAWIDLKRGRNHRI